MRKIVQILLVMAPAALALGLVACGSGSGPGAVVEAYQEAIQDGDYEAAYGYVSSQDRAVRSQQEFVENTRQAMVLFGSLVDQMSYEVTGEEIEGDRATVALNVTRPAVESLIGELMGAALSSALGEDGKGEEDVQEALREKLEAGDVPMTTDQETYNLVREEDGWKIVFGWHAEELLSQARKLRREGKPEEALAKLEEILAADPDREDAQTARDEVTAEIEVAYALNDYRQNHVLLEDFQVEQRRRFGFGDPEPAIVGKLKNQGERSLSHVWVTVYFLGPEGNPIAEKTYAPVSEYGGDGPLKPGYVRDFGYFVRDSAPSEWPGEARAEVSEIRFEETET